jgi:tetratricopeptide (TPR) repeat protein
MSTQDPPLELLKSLVNLYTAKKFKIAFSNAKELIEKFPESAITLNIAGAINVELSQFELAIEYYKKAVKIRPDYYEAFYNLGVAQQNKNYFKEAIKSYSEAIKIKPNYADSFNNMGYIQHKQGQFKEAIKSYSEAIKIHPNFASAYNNLANSLIEIGDFETAAKNFSEAIRINPDSTDAKSNIIKLLTFYSPKKNNLNPIIAINSEIRKIKVENDASKIISNQNIIDLILKSKKHLRRKIAVLTYQETQTYRNNSISLNCKRHMSIFKKNDIIPEFCFSCYKVQVEPSSVIDLIKLFIVFDQLNLDDNNTRKCSIELRTNIAGFYKGLIYCNGLKQATYIAKYLNNIIKNRIGPDIPIIVKRGCSEYPLSFPEYNQINEYGSHAMEYSQDWRHIEEEYDKKNPQNFNTKRRVSISGFNISDAIILLKWVDYAKGIKDPSLNLFTQDKIYFQDVYDLAKRRKESLKINKKQINLNQIS